MEIPGYKLQISWEWCHILLKRQEFNFTVDEAERMFQFAKNSTFSSRRRLHLHSQAFSVKITQACIFINLILLELKEGQTITILRSV